MEENHSARGLFSALKNITATLLASAKTRLELLANEFETEKLRLIQLVMMAQAMVFCFCMCTLLTIALLVMVFWEQRLLVLGFFSAAFLALGGFFLFRFRQSAHRPDKAFAASLAELQEDLHRLKSMTDRHEPPA